MYMNDLLYQDYKLRDFIFARLFSIRLSIEIANRVKRILQQHGAQECLPLAFGLILYAVEIMKNYDFTDSDIIETVRMFLNAVRRYNIMHFPAKAEMIEDV